MADPLLERDLRELEEPFLPPPEDYEGSTVVSEASVETSTPLQDDHAGPNNGVTNPWTNRNVLLSLALCVVSGIADSIWGSVVLSGYLYAMNANSSSPNTRVGTAEAIQGLTQLLAALPVGYLADTKLGKAKTVRWGGAGMLLAVAMTLGAVYKRSYGALVVALAMWGVVTGISLGPCQALYCDSIVKGRRSELLTVLYTCYLLSSAVGPVVGIFVLLRTTGDGQWSTSQLAPVFCVGVLLEIPAAIIMFFFSEKYVVPEVDNVETSSPPAPENTLETADPTAAMTIPMETNRAKNGEHESYEGTALEDDASPDVEDPTSGEPNSPFALAFWNPKGAIPYVLFLSSLVISLGSGASVKYFPLFFKSLGFGSAAVQGIFLLVPIFISTLSFLSQRLSKRIGRIETTVILDVLGVSLLLYMTWLSRAMEDQDEMLWEQSPHLALFIVTVYLFRTGIMNCSYPLLESVLMDSVPSDQRARWKSLESIASFGWTGSALVGGILSDAHSYRCTFAITAFLQLAGALLLLLIQPFVEAE